MTRQTLDTALDAIARLGEGLDLSPADRAALAIFDRHCTDTWAAYESRTDRTAADRCMVCGGPDGRECDSCTADWDAHIERSVDV